MEGQKKKSGKYLTFRVAGNIEISNLLKHFYMVVALYDLIEEKNKI